MQYHPAITHRHTHPHNTQTHTDTLTTHMLAHTDTCMSTHSQCNIIHTHNTYKHSQHTNTHNTHTHTHTHTHTLTSPLIRTTKIPMPYWWTMCDQNIYSFRNQIPFFQTLLPSSQIKCPITEFWLPVKVEIVVIIYRNSLIAY